MQTAFDTYEQAFAHAINRANKFRQAHGIEKPGTYALGLKDKWTIAMIPNDPAKRFGWERRCQPVEPGTPLSDKQAALLVAEGAEPVPAHPLGAAALKAEAKLAAARRYPQLCVSPLAAAMHLVAPSGATASCQPKKPV